MIKSICDQNIIMNDTLGDNLLMKLELSNLTHEKEKLIAENQLLKRQLEQMAMEFVLVPNANQNEKRKYTVTEETKAKWDYYHQNKKRVLEDLYVKKGIKEPPRWYDIKRVTDSEMKK